MYERIDTHLEAKFVFDGKEYEVEHFGIGFAQEVDRKGQPQAEMKGGQIYVSLTQSVRTMFMTGRKKKIKERMEKYCSCPKRRERCWK
jgi:hypothetical protein